MRKLELLAPAANKEIAFQAILHGADAVYIGASSHGARQNASNSIADIKEVVEFAHRFRARIYVTVNTLVYENEIEDVQTLIRELYKIGVDALIVQDMGVLRMDIPPIQLHASTQCDTRSVEKAIFLQNSGFSQIVLARELSIEEIRRICSSVKVPVECFVHGALCVSYSGRCQASQVSMGRSANRGECSQMCRLPYTLKNANGEIILKNKYLLSLADFNASHRMLELIEAGVSSFKIEGRLKDVSYVKNVTAAYRNIIDSIIAANPEKYCRSSYGKSDFTFTPNLDKSFNRGFTDYFLGGRSDGLRMASMTTPKSQGELIKDLRDIHNGDGISFIDPRSGEMTGCRVNRVEGGRIFTAGNVKIPPRADIRRTYDQEWQKTLNKPTAIRKIDLDVKIDESGISANDERGVRVRVPLDCALDVARNSFDPEPIFSKLGNTQYKLRSFINNLPDKTFIPASDLSSLRRRMVEELDRVNKITYPFHYRDKERKDSVVPYSHLDSRDNVANSLASKFYVDHGATIDQYAIEIAKNSTVRLDTPVMTTRYCLRRELGCCKKKAQDHKKAIKLVEPLTIESGPNRFRLGFDCSACEMNVYKD